MRQTEGMQELVLPGVSPHPRETGVGVKDAHGSRPGVLGDLPGWEARRPSLCLPPPTGLGSSRSECFMALQDSLPPKGLMFK